MAADVRLTSDEVLQPQDGVTGETAAEVTAGDPTAEDFFADLAARTAAEYREAADVAARAELLSAEELETERRRARQRSIERQAECCESAEQAGLSGEDALIFDRALARRRRREDATCAAVLRRAARGDFDPPASTLRRHGARSRQSRAAAPRRRGSRRCGRALARAGPSDDPGEPPPTAGRHSHDLAPLGRRSP